MTATEKFDLSELFNDSVTLHLSANSPTRNMIPFPVYDPYKDIKEKDPLDVIGERVFEKPEEVAENSIETPIQLFYSGVNVLITGGTGFIGKILTEKLVRSIPHLGHIYLLIRSKRGKNFSERFDHLLEDQVFSRMKGEVPEYRSKISAVDGDISEPGLGLSPSDRQLLLDNVHVVFHSAADVRFNEPLRLAISSNVLGTKRMVDLAKEIKQLKAFIHVSTAFSQCVRTVIEEKVPRLSENYREILKTVDIKTDEEIQDQLCRIMHGWPNTYTFSKAVCEDMVQEETVGLPACIFRPSIILPTYKEPVCGWSDNLYGPMGMFVGAGHGILHCMRMDVTLEVDACPVDYVVNCMIAVAWRTATRRQEEAITVYNYTSTPVNPYIWKSLIQFTLSIKEVWPYGRAIWYTSFFPTTSFLVSEVTFYLLHKLPGLFFDKVAVLLGQEPRLTKTYNKMRPLLGHLWYFTSKVWQFKNDNVIDLWRSLSEEDKSKFYFDLRDVDPLKFFLNGKLGLRYYFLKEKMESIPAASRKNTWLRWLHYSVKTACCLAVVKVMVEIARALPF